ncbi:HelD family protein [Cohnella faecalis]|uniref:DNA helicase UvrD n=1 Tax=Cohnella faecalis TaxID=2315694 RepID=A0A398CIP7_9BACL|nr:3'-5' exonuclease [Cohnella faecalis]RIE01069.1 DNA helicase UvrD [Cohnella faecalis]
MDASTELYTEERSRLDETFGEIERQRAGIGPVYYGNDFVEQLLEEKREETRRRLALLGSEPYFGRLDFQEKGKQSEPSSLYIGKRGMDRTETGEPYIIDWRAPVASLFYSFTGGDAPVAYEAPEGTIHGEVHRKRNLSIRDKELQRVVESYVRGGDNLGLSDDFLLYRLGEKKDNRLRDIVSTIQAEQDSIIRAPRHKALIIQGAAGSGKTTVALHRLAFLLYQYQGQIRAERMIIFAPNAMFLDYISGVLPELGVGEVKQTTFAEWALDRIGTKLTLPDHTDDKWFSLAKKRPNIDDETPGRFKGSDSFRLWLDGKLRQYEESYLQDHDFEAWDRRVLKASLIRQWFEVEYRHYPLAARRERLIGRIKRWLDMQLNEIGDPKIRKEKTKTSKQKLRTHLKKLPEIDEVAFYRSLFDQPNEFVPSDIAKETKNGLKRGSAQPEDLAPIVWIRKYFHGPEGLTFDHVVVDEAQDVSPFQITLLGSFMVEPSYTILGDLAQGIHAYRGVHRWEELASVFDENYSSYHELKQSYRSTLEIIEFANRILPFTDTGLPPAEPVFRSGDPVKLVQVANDAERLAYIRDFIRDQQAGSMRTISLIGRTAEDCTKLHERLTAEGIDTNLIAEGQSHYRGGVSIVPVHLAKGLEFDAVLLLDADRDRYPASPQDAKLLYVGCTRALHRLTLLHEGEPSELVTAADSQQ